MTPADLDAVMAVADAVHADHPEHHAVFEDRLALFAPGCHVLADGGAVVGYAIAHPIRLGHPVALDTVLGALAPGADCLHLHDLALLPGARGAGHPAAMLATLRGLGFAHLSLIAIHGLDAYWRRFGFVPAAADAVILGSYDPHAVYMIT